MSTHWDQDKYIGAYRFAVNAHKGQWIEGTTDLPYIVHPTLVSMEIIAALQVETGMDGDFAVQCALLHDVIEDTIFTYEHIKVEFGEKVANGVLALTKDRNILKMLQLEDSLHRITQQPREVWMVKLADRISNLQPPPISWRRDKIAAYHQEAIQISDTLGSASNFLVQRLKTKIEEYALS